ncbi:hypothetical protein PNEG_01088 [Pneumocystis murina B123]|uniref:Ubiquitin-like domain-containing protein n=1 Tax=Pneumocystis murina (strain B123) TaxID=1069680 RepID=M7NQE7_PNEMU|nr:hypothetical protein PNEG_01088 [Pneumocystis murina B123]EMR10943.1 hypothetical protein PNEG_01088 [Pneumocystis murina B123]
MPNSKNEEKNIKTNKFQRKKDNKEIEKQYDEEIMFFSRKKTSFKSPETFTDVKYKYYSKKYDFSFDPTQISSSETFSSDENTLSSPKSISSESIEKLPIVISQENKESLEKNRSINISKKTHKNTHKKITNKSHSESSLSPSPSDRKRSISLTPPPRLSKQIIQEGHRMYMNLTQETKINKKAAKETNKSEEKENNNFYIYDNSNIETYDQYSTNETKNTDITELEAKEFPENNKKIEIFEITVIGKRNIKTDDIFFPESWEEPILFKIHENQAFRVMKNSFCSYKKLNKSYYDQVVLVFREKRIFESATPKGINMLKYGSKITINAMSKKEYKHLISEIEKRKRLKDEDIHDFSNSTEKTLESMTYIIIDDPPIELILRDKDNESIKLSIDTNATISKLIETFKTSKNINTNTNITLIFEGEYLEPNLSISYYDFENGDLIDVQINN